MHILEVIFMKISKTIPSINNKGEINRRNTGNTRKKDFPEMRTRLEELRKDFEYTQEQVARKIGCSLRAYRSWIKGKYNAALGETIYIVPTLEYLQKLSVLYNVSIDYITGNSKYTRIGNKEMSQETGLTNDAIDALHMLHTPIDLTIADSQQIGRYDIIALNFILEDFYNNMKNTEDYQKFSSSTDTLLNQIGQYIDSNSAKFDTKSPVFLQNGNTTIFPPGDIAKEIIKARILDSLSELKEKHSLDIIIKTKENSEYFDMCLSLIHI